MFHNPSNSQKVAIVVKKKKKFRSLGSLGSGINVNYHFFSTPHHCPLYFIICDLCAEQKENVPETLGQMSHVCSVLVAI